MGMELKIENGRKYKFSFTASSIQTIWTFSSARLFQSIQVSYPRNVKAPTVYAPTPLYKHSESLTTLQSCLDFCGMQS